jgi:DNA invertase Pin-like site-specific DNA recombinase
MSKVKITALYERLSKDDGDSSQESNSIATQKRILESYAEQNGLTPYRHFSDDGFSGKDFQRPAFREMLSEIESGNVGTVAVKNLDRFGRSYLESGLYREKFRRLGVRFIAIGDGIDSANGEDDFTPFREVINEFYVKQYSDKIKAAFRSRGMSGKHTSSYPPYGYLKSPEDKHQWVVDGEAAEVVKRVYAMTLDGMGPYQIACALEAEKALIPAAYLATKGAGLHQHKVFENPYHWGSSTICAILKKKEYLGHTVNFKSKKDSYKDKKNHYVPEDEWVIFENTHEAIIDQATFDAVQRIRSNVKRRPDGWGYTHPLTGLLYCADCGAKLYVQRINNGKPKPYYTCHNYRKVPVGVDCPTPHRVDAETVMTLVAETLRRIVKIAIEDKAAFRKSVLEKLSDRQTDDVKKQKKRLAVVTKRLADLEILQRKTYEDNALGKLPDKRIRRWRRATTASSPRLNRSKRSCSRRWSSLLTATTAPSGLWS